ncbi:MAG: alpha/beta hydrolase, partial [Vicinamibacterales bacterium]
GSFEAMQTSACTKFWGAHLVEGAGHWVQQEQPDATIRHILQFLKSVPGTNGVQ